MRYLLLLSILIPGLAGLNGLPARADDTAWVVVSMRQYLIEGSSRIHLYLYSFDGKFQKVLTNDPGFNDLNPVFSDDGKSILFSREAADKAHASQAGKYELDLASSTIHRFDSRNYYSTYSLIDRFSSAFGPGSDGWLNIDAKMYQSPDGRFSITENENPARDKTDPESGNEHVYSATTPGKQPVLLAGLPGFIPTNEIDGYESFFIGNGSPYIMSDDMALVFLRHHLGSTDGEEIWGLDLTTMKGAKISPNGAEIYHPPSAPGVFIVAEARYLPLGATGKTVNCSYLEWWDPHLKETRYGPDLSVFYSAAIFGGGEYKTVTIGDSP